MHKILEITLHHTSGGQKSLSIPYPAGAFAIDVVVKPLQQICDAIIQLELTATHASCKAGCSHCCNQLIPLSAAEVIFLNKTVQTLPRSKRRKLSAALRSTREKAQRMIATSNGAPTGFDERYFNLGIPCPFLEQGRCGIYEHRPLVCREYHVDTPPSHCRTPYNTFTNRVAKGLNLGAMLTAFSAKMLRVDKMPIPLFLLDVWNEGGRYATTAYDSLTLLEALLNGMKTVAGKHSELRAIEWRYAHEKPANSTAPKRENGTGITFRPGAIIEPLELPKLLVKYANAQNVQKIIETLIGIDKNLLKAEYFLEIGAGDGYFRYLASLTQNNRVQWFSDRIIETESDADTVEKNRARGKETLLANAQELVQQFGPCFTPLVLSMNVLDIFPVNELEPVLRSIAQVLKPGGYIVHIMSSSIHAAVFQDIAVQNAGKVLLPYVHNHTIGVILVDRSAWSHSHFPAFFRDQTLLARLFRQAPEDYIRIAGFALETLTTTGQPYGTLLLHEYSVQKLTTQLNGSGFEVVHRQWLNSSKVRQPTHHHKAIGDANQVTNHLGALLVEHSPNIPSGRIKEASTFGLIVGRRGATPNS